MVPKILQYDAAPFTHVPCVQYVPTSRVTHMQEQHACTVLACYKKTNEIFVFNLLSNGQKKGKIVKYRDFLHLIRLILPAKPKACPPQTSLQKQPGQHLSRLGSLANLTNLQLLHLSRLPLLTPNNSYPCLGA